MRTRRRQSSLLPFFSIKSMPLMVMMKKSSLSYAVPFQSQGHRMATGTLEWSMKSEKENALEPLLGVNG